MISDLHGTIRTDDYVKDAILSTVQSRLVSAAWSHCMGAVGFRKDPIDGRTIWILKNSWGTNWGDHGYGYLIVPLDISPGGALDGPVVTS